MPWWANATIYEVYVRSFADSDGDGIGDIPGIIGRLDYLAWLGVDAIWLTPIMPSPGNDHGYDVTDYLDVDPLLGTLADVDQLVDEARNRQIRVLMDLVPNHTSREHAWFKDPATKHRYYVWTEEPNNWVGTFQIPSWTFDPGEQQFYLHSYLPEQPDLNWWDDGVRAEFDDILRFWFDRGIAGFRIDACYIIVKDRLLRDNPPVGPQDHPWDRNRGQRPLWSAHQPEVHDILRRWRSIASCYEPERLLLGATWVPEVDDLAKYFGAHDELQLPQYFQLLFSPFEARDLQQRVEQWLTALPPREVPVWAASSHDHSRFPSRWCDGDQHLVRTALTMMLTLPGACILYQGDEIGMQDTILPFDLLSEPKALSREPYRTPMPWVGATDGGFTAGHPWLPLGDVDDCNVAAQLEDSASILHHTRALIAQKKTLDGQYELESVSETEWSYRRGGQLIRLDFSTGRPAGSPR